jgi:hypothetical protein
LLLTLSMVSEDSTSRVMVFPVTVQTLVDVDGKVASPLEVGLVRSDKESGYSRVLTKICILTVGKLFVAG